MPPTGIDPLKRLGYDVFHMVVAELSLRDLSSVERVSRSWHTFSKSQTLIWKRTCERERVDMTEWRDWHGWELENTGITDEGTNEWRSAAMSHVALQTNWHNGYCVGSSVTVPSGMQVQEIIQGPEDHMVTLKLGRRGGSSCLKVVDKYTAEELFVVEDVGPTATVVSGGGYLAVTVADPRLADVWHQPTAPDEPYGVVAIFRTPAAREAAGEPPLELERNSRGVQVLERRGTLDWMCDWRCDDLRMFVSMDKGPDGTRRPVLVATDGCKLFFTAFGEKGSRREVDLQNLGLQSMSNIIDLRVDDDYIFFCLASRVEIFSRSTEARIVSFATDWEDGRIAACAYKMPTQTTVDLFEHLPRLERKKTDHAGVARDVKFRRVLDYGKSESIWADDEGYDTDHYDVDSISELEAMEEDDEEQEMGEEPHPATELPSGLASAMASAGEVVNAASSSEAGSDAEDPEWPIPAPFTWFDLEELTGAGTSTHHWQGFTLTNNDIVITGNNSGLLVVRNYREALRELAAIDDEHERSKRVACHTVLISFLWGPPRHDIPDEPLRSVKTSGDSIVCLVPNTGIIVIDSTRLPHLPLDRNNAPVPELSAAVLSLPWVGAHFDFTPFSVDARSIYFAFNDRSGNAAELVFAEHDVTAMQRWHRMMDGCPNAVRKWTFRASADAMRFARETAVGTSDEESEAWDAE